MKQKDPFICWKHQDIYHKSVSAVTKRRLYHTFCTFDTDPEDIPDWTHFWQVMSIVMCAVTNSGWRAQRLACAAESFTTIRQKSTTESAKYWSEKGRAMTKKYNQKSNNKNTKNYSHVEAFVLPFCCRKCHSCAAVVVLAVVLLNKNFCLVLRLFTHICTYVYLYIYLHVFIKLWESARHSKRHFSWLASFFSLWAAFAMQIFHWIWVLACF